MNKNHGRRPLRCTFGFHGDGETLYDFTARTGCTFGFHGDGETLYDFTARTGWALRYCARCQSVYVRVPLSVRIRWLLGR